MGVDWADDNSPRTFGGCFLCKIIYKKNLVRKNGWSMQIINEINAN